MYFDPPGQLNTSPWRDVLVGLDDDQGHAGAARHRDAFNDDDIDRNESTGAFCKISRIVPCRAAPAAAPVANDISELVPEGRSEPGWVADPFASSRVSRRSTFQSRKEVSFSIRPETWSDAR